jgi:predicted nucleotidyltransferase
LPASPPCTPSSKPTAKKSSSSAAISACAAWTCFGSATGDAFDPQRSDIDFVVDFGPGAQPDLFNRYFGLNEALAALFGRKVDLVMTGAMANPYFIDSVNRTRQPVYARPLTEAA